MIYLIHKINLQFIYETKSVSVAIKDVEQSKWKDEVWDRHIVPDEKYLYKKPGYSCDE